MKHAATPAVRHCAGRLCAWMAPVFDDEFVREMMVSVQSHARAQPTWHTSRSSYGMRRTGTVVVACTGYWVLEFYRWSRVCSTMYS